MMSWRPDWQAAIRSGRPEVHSDQVFWAEHKGKHSNLSEAQRCISILIWNPAN